MKTSAFRFLHPRVQFLYQSRLQQHEQILAQQAKEALMNDFKMIPMGGGLITVSGLKDAEGNVIRLPHDSLMWLIEKLATQGAVQTEASDLNEGVAQDIGAMMGQINNAHTTNNPEMGMVGI